VGVSSYLEFVTVLFGWIMYDRLWSVLADTGIVYAPFIVIILKNVIESRKGGDDEGSAAVQSLKKNEADIIVAIVVMIVAAVPFTEVRLAEMTYVRPKLDCAVAERIDAGREPGTVAGDAADVEYEGTLASISGQVGRVPIWWGFVHVVSKAVVSAGVAAIPCSHDVAGFGMALAEDRIQDSVLLKEVADFELDCHGKAYAKWVKAEQRAPVMRQRGEYVDGVYVPDPAMAHDLEYMGARFYIETAGYYDKLWSKAVRPAFAREGFRDWFTQPGSRGKHPWCTDWWGDPANGLRGRLLEAIDPANRDDWIHGADSLLATQHPDSTVAEREDMLLRKYLAGRHLQWSGSTFGSYDVSAREAAAASDNVVAGVVAFGSDVIGGIGTTAAAGLGMILKAPGNAAAGLAIRQGMPMFLALLLMIFVAVLPFLMVFSRYEPGTLLVLTIIFFGLQFVYVLWGIAFWVDQNLYAAVMGPSSLPVENPIQAGIMVWVQRFLYLVFPMIWLMGLGWVGVQAQQAFGESVGTPTGGVGATAAAGGDLAANAAAGGVKGAIGKGGGGGKGG